MKSSLKSNLQVFVVIPNWNGEDRLRQCLASLQKQSLKPHIVVVDNGSVDSSIQILVTEFPEIEIVRHTTNKGYTGGVNPGFRLAIERGAIYVAPFNNDAVADKSWLQELVTCLDTNPEVGIATCKILSSDGSHLDSTGDHYTTWGLSYPRGRGETDTGQYDHSTEIFGASGGASLYRTAMLREVGLFDESFFAYYEDVDLSFRAQLAGWKVAYVPDSRVYHEMSVTGSRIKGFFTLQTMKNLPLLFWKNVPTRLLPVIWPRFTLAYLSFVVSAAGRGQLRYAFEGMLRALVLLPGKLLERHRIQGARKVSVNYISSMLVWDLPPNARRLRILRGKYRRLAGKG